MHRFDACWRDEHPGVFGGDGRGDPPSGQRGSPVLAHNLDRGNLTGRGYDRVRWVARTLADLGDSEQVEGVHVLEALSYRSEI